MSKQFSQIIEEMINLIPADKFSAENERNAYIEGIKVSAELMQEYLVDFKVLHSLRQEIYSLKQRLLELKDLQ